MLRHHYCRRARRVISFMSAREHVDVAVIGLYRFTGTIAYRRAGTRASPVLL